MISQSRNGSATRLLCNWRLNRFVCSDLRPSQFGGMRRAQRGGMNTTSNKNNQFESTYGLLVRSEEKGRGVLEIAVYAALCSQCRLLDLPVRADARHNSSSWN
jgi:hypothetical protein